MPQAQGNVCPGAASWQLQRGTGEPCSHNRAKDLSCARACPAARTETQSSALFQHFWWLLRDGRGPKRCGRKATAGYAVAEDRSRRHLLLFTVLKRGLITCYTSAYRIAARRSGISAACFKIRVPSTGTYSRTSGRAVLCKPSDFYGRCFRGGLPWIGCRLYANRPSR